MPVKLKEPNAYGGVTDHGDVIAVLRTRAGSAVSEGDKIALHLAADLLTAHDQSGISLDDWPWARRFVEMWGQQPVLPNSV